MCPEHTHSRSLELGTEAVDDSIKADKDSNDTTVTALENPSSPIFHDSIANFWALVHFCTLICHFHRGFREFMVAVNHSFKQFRDTCIQKSIKMNDLKKVKSSVFKLPDFFATLQVLNVDEAALIKADETSQKRLPLF